MIDDHELGLRLRLRIRVDLPGGRFLAVGILKTLAGLRFPLYRHRSDDARPAGDRGELLEAPLAEHRRAVYLVALLRYRADDLVTERLHQKAQFFDACSMRNVVDTSDLDADEDRTRDWRVCFPYKSLARRAGALPPFRARLVFVAPPQQRRPTHVPVPS